VQETINESVAVLASFRKRPDIGTITVTPHVLEWRGRRYKLATMGLHHPERRGTKRFHIFSFAAEGTSFRVELDPDTLEWTLVEVFYER
jgi:hypothetical protein